MYNRIVPECATIDNAAHPNTAMNDIQAPKRRNEFVASQGAASQPPARNRRNVAVEEIVPQVGRTGSPGIRRSPTKPANLKNRKLNQRMIYDPDLGRHRIPVVTAINLMERIASEDNIMMAVKKINAEPNKAVGVDRKTVRQVCSSLLNFPEVRETLSRRLTDGDYRPQTVRLTYIPKANGKLRKLGIAIVLDRVVQRMILQVVEEAIPDNTWSSSSFAYLHGTGLPAAIESAGRIITDGYEYAVCLDLKAFFDNIPHQRLRRKLEKHITDKRVVRLIWFFVTTAVMDHGVKSINRKGTPQGSVISPWLASKLYLDELDRELEARGHRFVRYADDCTIFCKSPKAAKRIRGRLIEFVENTMGCPVNKDKTKIAPVGSISMLGLHRRNGKWCLNRDKEKTACGIFLALLNRYKESGSPEVRLKAIQMFNGFINHYGNIPDLAEQKVPSLKRWMARKLREAEARIHEKR